MATFDQTIQYLYKQLPMYQRVGKKAFKKDLNNIQAMMKIMGAPQNRLKAIHIAGTNGKGSVSNMLAAIFIEAGYTTGLYTSPHLKDFRERIRLNGALISKQYVIHFVRKYRPEFNKIKPSFFEWTVALAFDYFSRKKVEIAIIETGLGGRLDSTNVIHPLLSIITNISLDHTAFLGETRALIATEKAGIIKQNTPIIVGQKDKETEPVFRQKARLLNAGLTFVEERYKIINLSTKLGAQKFDFYREKKLWMKGIPLSLNGSYQAQNLSTCLAAIDNLKKQDFKLKETAIRRALSRVEEITGFRGRMQIMSKQPLVLYDVAHNVAGSQILMNWLKEIKYNELHIVLGFVNDKSLDNVLKLYPKHAHYYFAKADIPRGLDAKKLQKQALNLGLTGQSYSSVKEAFKTARKKVGNQDCLLVCGSIFVVAELV